MKNSGRFVIHKHSRLNEPPHWDLMFEANNSLETYRLTTSPLASRSTRIRAERIFDHPVRFLAYEGSVNDGAGSVAMADSGTYRLIAETDDARRIELLGATLKCFLVLTRDSTGSFYFTKEDIRPGRR